MAKHDGIISLSGKVGDLVFVKQKRGNYAKSKSFKPIKQTVASKKSSADFGSATSAAARIRKAFAPLILKYGDHTLINRLNSLMIKIFTTIPSAFAGHKKLVQGDINWLPNLQFNSIRRLDSFLKRPVGFTIQSEGELLIKLGSAPTVELFKHQDKAISVVLTLMVYNMDLNGTADEVMSIVPLSIKLDQEFRGAKLKVPLVLDGERLVLVAMGIHYNNLNGEIGARKAKGSAIVFASKLKDGADIPYLPLEPVPILQVQQTARLTWDVM